MAHWDPEAGRIIAFPDEVCEEYPGWLRIDCGCCNGMEWHALEPTTCSRCGGNAVLYLHEASRALAVYPGGPFIGHA